MSVCCECCVLLGRGLCDQLITRPEESYRLRCVVVCDLEASRICAPYIYIYDISSLRVKESAHDHTPRRKGDQVLDKLRIMPVTVFCIIATCSVLRIY